jgi:histidine triad (HIT) family protein
MTDETLFTKIINGAIPCDKVYEDEHTFAFRDINPGAPVHVLVVPKKPIARLTDAEPADAELLGRLLLTANKVAQMEGIAESGFRCVVNTNQDAGQTVWHLHVHVLGGRALQWPPG